MKRIEDLTVEDIRLATDRELQGYRIRFAQLFEKWSDMDEASLLPGYRLLMPEMKKRGLLWKTTAIDRELFGESVRSKAAEPEADPATEVLKSIGGIRNLPLDDSASWDGAAAVARMRNLAGGPDKDEIDWKKYRAGFVWYDSDDSENFGSYKLPFADVVDDKLTAVWGGVYRAMSAVLGSRGGVDLDGDEESAYSFLKSYYKRFEKDVPDFSKRSVDVSIISKSDDDERIILGVVYAPDEEDTQGDSATVEEIKKAAYSFMESGQKYCVMHNGVRVDLCVLENYLAPVDFTVETAEGTENITKGTWMLASRVPAGELWADVKSGALTGYSMGGTTEQV